MASDHEELWDQRDPGKVRDRQERRLPLGRRRRNDGSTDPEIARRMTSCRPHLAVVDLADRFARAKSFRRTIGGFVLSSLNCAAQLRRIARTLHLVALG